MGGRVKGGGRVGGQGEWERRSEACVKIQKKNAGGGEGVGVGRVGGGGGQGGCEWRSEVFVKIQKKKMGGGGGSGQGGSSWGCQGGWERRIGAFVKIIIFFLLLFFFLGGGGCRVGGGASGWGVRVDVNGEVKFL